MLSLSERRREKRYITNADSQAASDSRSSTSIADGSHGRTRSPSTASAMLSANTSLTTRRTVKPLSVAR